MFESDVKAAHFGATMTEDVAIKARMSFMMNIGFGFSYWFFMMMKVVGDNDSIAKNRHHHCEIHVRINSRIRSVDRMDNSKK